MPLRCVDVSTIADM